MASGKRWIVDMDLEKFFDWVNHDMVDVSGSQASQRQASIVVDSALSTSGNHGRRTDHSEPRRNTARGTALAAFI